MLPNHNQNIEESNLQNKPKYVSGTRDKDQKYKYNKCQKKQSCPRAVYKDQICKKHYLDQIKAVIRMEMKKVYRGPDQAYSAIDYTGKGHITEEDFLSCLIIKRITQSKYLASDVQEYLHRDNLFQVNDPDSKMDFETFKKVYFPQLFHVKDDNLSEDEHDDLQKLKQGVAIKKGDQQQVISDKLTKVENMIKDKFANNWVSVRKAFLDLDTDYDGYVTVEDILRYFGSEGQNKEFDFRDLKKLIVDKDSKRQGKISYADFSKWMGGVIHQSEGFYFRHDSMKNPQYERQLKNYQEKIMKNNYKIMKEQLEEMDIESTVIEKIKFQWKTLKKAFIDLNQEKSGAIKPRELQLYLHHWGLFMNDEQFKKLFDKFDHDKDGKISYEDFQNTVGMEINPMEFLYFRQDNPKQPRQQTCKHDKCWEPPVGFSDYCLTHVKMFKERGLQILTGLSERINNWQDFLKKVRQNSEKDDSNIIKYKVFLKILEDYNIKFTEREKELVMQSFVANQDRQSILINVSRLYSIKLTNKIKKIYDKVDMYEEADNPDLVDNSGYFGIFYREKVNLLDLTDAQFIEIILKNNKLVGIMKNIKEIDKDNNGYVTNQELDDIFKMHYEKELGNKDLKKLFKPFASIQNRILIDYKKLRDHILLKLKEKGDVSRSNLVTQSTEKPQNLNSHSKNANSTQLRQDKRAESLRNTDKLSIFKQNMPTTDRQNLQNMNQSVYKNNSFALDNNGLNTSMRDFNQRIQKTPDPMIQKLRESSALKNEKLVLSPDQSALINRVKTPSLMQKPFQNFSMISKMQNIGKGVPELGGKIEQIKPKLAYEWKNIYRALSLQDSGNSGKISKKIFEKTVHQNGVYLTKEETLALFVRFSENENDIDYGRLSRELGLQSNSLNLVSQTHQYLSKIHQYGQQSVVAGQHSRPMSQASGLSMARPQQFREKSIAGLRNNKDFDVRSLSRSVVSNQEFHNLRGQSQQKARVPEPLNNSMFSGGNEYKIISKTLNKNLEQVKETLKRFDGSKRGFLSEQQMQQVMKSFNLQINNYNKFKKGSSDEIDYIKFLKYYL